MMSQKIYLDHNATTPVDPRVLKTMLPYFTDKFGNAASIDHDFGYEAKQVVEDARELIAKSINALPDEIIFTSGATESDNISLIGVAEKNIDKGDHIITCVTEHKAILDTCKHLKFIGKRITYLPVDKFGLVDPNDVKKAITPKTILISIMAANNEIGTLAPIKEIGEIAHQNGVLFHTDAAQAIGHIPIDVRAMNIDLMSISAHKIYGPKGVGALYKRRSNPFVKIAPIIFGGGHEKGIRSGTLNVPGIVGLGKAIELAQELMLAETELFWEWTEYILGFLKNGISGIEQNGHPKFRLPHTINLNCKGIESKALIVGLHDIAISTGSACTSALVEPSHVIMSLGFGELRAHSAIRIGVGRSNNQEQIYSAADRIASEANKLRNL